ncbi:hypothetical protein KFK09_020957 [Dendrobium nobile]|uniref:Uncharacterized protein n=1 Tax=Dendrobium nobile TaxID=94219 RepID=A0A8T3AN40_DENNO|nr:hypothetical protein KFK09_020957 [Dendrobium nobile]
MKRRRVEVCSIVATRFGAPQFSALSLSQVLRYTISHHCMIVRKKFIGANHPNTSRRMTHVNMEHHSSPLLVFLRYTISHHCMIVRKKIHRCKSPKHKQENDTSKQGAP